TSCGSTTPAPMAGRSPTTTSSTTRIPAGSSSVQGSPVPISTGLGLRLSGEAEADPTPSLALGEEAARQAGGGSIGEAVPEAARLAADEQPGAVAVGDGEQLDQPNGWGAGAVEEAGGFDQEVVGVERKVGQGGQGG